MQVRKRILECSVGENGLLLFPLFSPKFPPKNLPLAGETKDNKYTWRAQYNEKLYAVFGKNESFLKKRINYSLIQLGMMIYFTGEVSGSNPG